MVGRVFFFLKTINIFVYYTANFLYFRINECKSVVSCVQLDLETIKDMYLEKFDVTLKDALSSDCGGDFKRLLLAILH